MRWIQFELWTWGIVNVFLIWFACPTFDFPDYFYGFYADARSIPKVLLFALTFNLLPGFALILRVRHFRSSINPFAQFACAVIGGLNAIVLPLGFVLRVYLA